VGTVKRCLLGAKRAAESAAENKNDDKRGRKEGGSIRKYGSLIVEMPGLGV